GCSVTQPRTSFDLFCHHNETWLSCNLLAHSINLEAGHLAIGAIMCASSKILSAALVLQTVSALSAQPRTGTVLWSYDLGSSVLTSPALSPDGTIYLGTRAGLCAVTNNGITASNKWTLSATVSYSGSPAIAADGTIYVGA